jgi:hypothetical protein
MEKLKILIGILILIVFSLSVNAQVMTKVSKDVDVRVSFVNQDPDPAEPGKYVDVRFNFENEGADQAKDVVIELLPEYPFSLEPGKSAIKNLGALYARQLGETAVTVKYKLRIDKNAVEGENELKLRYKFDGYEWIEPDNFNIDIQTHDAILAVEAVSMDKDALEPGSSGIVKIKLSNKADSILKDIKVTLGLGDLPLVPIDSTNEKSIYKIDSKQGYEFKFKVLVKPDADSGVYNVPLSVFYLDELGKGYLKNVTIGLTIGAKPDLSITLDDSDIYESSKPGEVVVKVVNKGVTNIKFMNMKLMPSEDYRILSNEEVYIGNIDSDDYETADFDLFIEKNKKDKIKIPVVIEYKDANNNDFKETIELVLNLYSDSEAKKFGLVKGNNKAGIFIVILIVVIGLFAYRRWIKRKKKRT